MRAYWFEPDKGVLRYGDRRKPEVGVTHTVEAPIKLCHRGLHASVRAIDALKYAKSNIVWEVELGGEIIKGDDKCVAIERTYLRRIDATYILRRFSRQCALSVAHLWDMPPLVREFLETGNPDLRYAARYAGALATAGNWTAAWGAADAAMDADWGVVAHAAMDAAMDAAWAAADAAAAAAAMDANRTAADAADAAMDAAWAAADAAAAMNANRTAADAVARTAQNVLLEQLLREAK